MSTQQYARPSNATQFASYAATASGTCRSWKTNRTTLPRRCAQIRHCRKRRQLRAAAKACFEIAVGAKQQGIELTFSSRDVSALASTLFIQRSKREGRES